MKITTENYFDTVNKIGFENLPVILKQSHTVILTKTDNGEDWSRYQNDADLKRMIDLAFKKLEEFMASSKENLKGVDDESYPELERAKQDAAGYHQLPTETLKRILQLEKGAEYQDGLQPHIIVRKTALERILAEREGSVKTTKKKEKVPSKNPYIKIKTEIKFIHRFLDFHDKVLYKNTFEIFIDELQKAIQKKEITKKSPVAKDIVAMQNAAINAFNTMKNAKHFVLKPETIKRYKSIIEKYENAYDDLPTEKKPKRKSIGLTGIPQNSGKIMSSLDFANLQFSTIGLKDKWLEFIGDPAPGFTAMVYGRPKMGKSYLCVDFAGYLARNHGKVLYVAKEEKLDATLQKKLKDKDVANDNLFVADNLPKNLSEYLFVILDSVNKLGLNPQDLAKLKSDNPGVSFIYIFQSTKEGKFRGTNEFQHDVDVIIEVPEKGIAIQNGRFNQGGEMRIFENDLSGEDDLSGIKKAKKKPVSDWTEPEWLNEADWHDLKIIKKYYDKKDYKSAMNHAMNCDTVIREEIPPDVWKKMGGQLTKTGEEKLKAMKQKSSPKITEQIKKTIIPFNHGVRLLKGVIEREWDLELTDGDYIEILDIAQERSSNLPEIVNAIHNNLSEFLTIMRKALKEWDEKTGKSVEKSREKFYPEFYAKRKDDENPGFVFSLTNTKVLTEALQGDFDLVYLVRRELANRGLDSQGKWIGFDEAKKIHRVD